jgi:hypothetical protein
MQLEYVLDMSEFREMLTTLVKVFDKLLLLLKCKSSFQVMSVCRVC